MANEKNLIGKGFDANPENINRKGRPRKTFARINASLAAKGAEKVNKGDYLSLLTLLFNSTEAEIKALIDSSSTPYAVKLICHELSGPNAYKIIQDMRDFCFGTPAQTVNHSVAPARVLSPDEMAPENE